jgi:hypothetical protein
MVVHEDISEALRELIENLVELAAMENKEYAKKLIKSWTNLMKKSYVF